MPSRRPPNDRARSEGDRARPEGRPRTAGGRARRGGPRDAPDNQPIEEAMRLNRYLARAGVASRRKADDLIAAGKVRLNGDVVTELGTTVQPGDRVEVGGRIVSLGESVYLLLNKPTDTITTASDEKGRKTVLDLLDLPESKQAGLFPVGRLDRNTTGVLLLTTDGELAHRLTHPSYQIEKLYRVRTKDSIKPHELDQLRRGVELEDGVAAFDQATYLDPDDHHAIGVSLHEGRNRQIRRMLEHLGHEVTALERVRYAGLTADGVRRGKWRALLPHEVARLRRLVKLRS